MGIIKIRDLIHDYFGHDDEEDQEVVSRAVNRVNLDVEAGSLLRFSVITDPENLPWPSISMHF